MKKELIQRLLQRAAQENILGASTFYNILHKWPDKEEKIEEVLTLCLVNMHRKFKSDERRVNKNSGFILMFSMAQVIGSYFYTSITGYRDNTVLKLRQDVQAGSIIIDNLIDLGCITVSRGKYYRAPYIILQGPKWKQLISELSPTALVSSAITFTKPKPISSFVSPITGRKVVKRGATRSDFEKMKDTTFTKGCDVLQQTAWRINRNVLEGVRDHPWLHEDTEYQLGNTNMYDDLPEEGSPIEVKDLMQKVKNEPDCEDLKVKLETAHNKWEFKKAIISHRSKVLEKEAIVKAAEVLVDQREFFNAIEADYRGRIYYCHPNLHYQGSDLAKGLLEFSEGVELNANGFRWLLIHAACCYNAMIGPKSVDKLSLAAREQWSIDNMKFIRRVAHSKIIDENAEKPIMFLAVCLEIDNARKHWESNVPFISHLPVPIDGSNNGSQHCAAINRDMQTAMQVGMTNTPEPIDLYNNVGRNVIQSMPDFFDTHNMSMQEVRKNIAKRSCMVRGYSAGIGSIADNMFSDCYKNGITNKYGITYKDCTILSRACVAAIDQVCPSNRTVQKYLQKVVAFEIGRYEQDKVTKEWRLAYGNGKSDINWTAPSGFIVKVVKTSWKRVPVNIQLQGESRCLMGRWKTNRACVKSHVSGIAANVIHSMDASHLLKCAVHFEDQSFAGVHDSFAVHANSVDDLVKIVKEEFIAMYNGNDFYEYIRDEIVSNKDSIEFTIPEQGDYDLNELRDSDYFFC